MAFLFSKEMKSSLSRRQAALNHRVWYSRFVAPAITDCIGPRLVFGSKPKNQARQLMAVLRFDQELGQVRIVQNVLSNCFFKLEDHVGFSLI